MTEAMPFLQKYDITFLRPPAIWRGNFFPAAPGESKFIPDRGNPRWSTKKSPRLLAGRFFLAAILRYRHCPALRAHNHYLQ